MSEEQGSFDFYNEYAKSRKLEISTIDQIVNVRHGCTKRIAVIYGIKDLFFIAYSNPGDMSTIGMFCGVFFESDISPELTFSLKKANPFTNCKIKTVTLNQIIPNCFQDFSQMKICNKEL